MSTVRLVPQNPLDLRPEELEDLAQDFREAGYEVEIDDEIRQRGYGVTWYEVLTVILPAALALAQATATATKWAWRRFQKQEQEQRQRHEEEEAQKPRRGGRRRKWEPSLRPKYVRIYGPHDELLKVLVFRKPDEEPEDVAEEEGNR